LGIEVEELKQRVEVLEQDNLQPLAAKKVAKGDIKAVVAEGIVTVKKDFVNLEQEPAKLKEEKIPMTRGTRGFCAAGGRCNCSTRPESSGLRAQGHGKATMPKRSHFAAETRPSDRMTAARLAEAGEAIPSVDEERSRFDIPDGIIAHLTRECGGNVYDCQVIKIMSGSLENETYGPPTLRRIR
jgi:hypothetical protein